MYIMSYKIIIEIFFGMSVNYGHHYLFPFGSLIIYHGISRLSVLHPTEALRIVNFSKNKKYSSLCIISNYFTSVFYTFMLYFTSPNCSSPLKQFV